MSHFSCFWLYCFLCLLFERGSAFENVYVLEPNNFTEFIENNSKVLILFHSSNDLWSQGEIAYFERAATIVHTLSKFETKLAVFDNEFSSNITDIWGVTTFPVVKYFKHNPIYSYFKKNNNSNNNISYLESLSTDYRENAIFNDYNPTSMFERIVCHNYASQITENQITQWISKHEASLVQPITNIDVGLDILSNSNVKVVAYIMPQINELQYIIFNEIAEIYFDKKLTHISFYIIDDINIALSIDPLLRIEYYKNGDNNENSEMTIGQHPLLVIYKPFDEEAEDKRRVYKENNLTNINGIIEWIEMERFPLVSFINPLNFNQYNQRRLPIVWLSIDNEIEEHSSEVEHYFQHFARHYKGLLCFLIITSNEYIDYIRKLGIPTMPGMMIQDGEYKYLFDPDVNPMEDVYSSKFFESFFENTLPRYIKSQNEEEIQQNIMFDEEILNNSTATITQYNNNNKSDVKYINGYQLYELIENGTPEMKSIYTNEEIQSFKRHLWTSTTNDDDNHISDTNNEWINNMKLNVMVLYYTTWDTRCNKLVPVYENITKYWLHHNRTILLTKINIMENDVCDTSLFYSKLPIIALYKHDSTSCRDAIFYSGKRKSDVIIRWMKIKLNISIDNEKYDEREFYDDRDDDESDNVDPFYAGAKQQ